MPDTTQIEAIYRQYGHSVLRRARQISGNEQDAQEVLQEVFASLIADPAQFRGQSAVSTWLYSATTHLCLNRLRNARTRSRLLADQVGPALTEAAAPRALDMAMARQLLARLPDELARVAVHYYFDEMTHEEIADVLGCSRRQVGNLLQRLQKLALGQEKVA